MDRLLAPILALSLPLTFIGCDSTPEVSGPESLSYDFRPNVVWLVAEDLSAVIPAYGDSTITTPNLTRLAGEGVLYTNVFSPSGVCAPSRAAIATGMYPTRIGALHMRTGPWWRGNPSPETVESYRASLPAGLIPYEAVPPAGVRMHSEHLRLAGYYTSNNAKEDYQFRAPVTAWDESGPDAHWRNRKPGQPFFAIFNFNVTHESRIWAKASDSLWVDEGLRVPVPPYLPETPIALRDIRRMYSNVREMDFLVGRVLAELEQDGLLDSTIVFWFSDQGGPLPRQKRLLYDSGLHVPFLVRFPDAQVAGHVDDRLISFVDLMPTLLSLAGVKPPSYVDGQAFLGLYAASEPRQYVHGAADRFDERHDMIRAVRDMRFKYLRNYRTDQGYYLPIEYRERMPIMQELLRLRDAGQLSEYQAQWFRSSKPEEELFDTVSDPHELSNLADDPAFAAKLTELRAECDRWMQETGDMGLVPEVEMIESMWPGMTQPVTSPPVADVAGRLVRLRTVTEGASIGFQVLGPSESPGSTWEVYTEPVTLEAGERVVAVAHRIGYLPSEAVQATAR